MILDPKFIQTIWYPFSFVSKVISDVRCRNFGKPQRVARLFEHSKKNAFVRLELDAID